MQKTENVAVKLANGTTVYFEATILGGEEEVAFGLPTFKSVTDAIEGISESVLAAVKKVMPSKASIEFSIEVGIESGQLTALIVKGEGKGNLKITVEWDENDSKQKK